MTARFCDRCGERLDGGGEAAAGDGGTHDPCRLARRLEPPRYCGECGRRMVVQVTPGGWVARCVAHRPVSQVDGWSAVE